MSSPSRSMDTWRVNTTNVVWTSEEPFKTYRNYYERQIIASMTILISILGIIGNTLVITAVPLSKKLRTVTNVFVLNLSVSDLLSCLFLPWDAVAVLSEDGWPLQQANWLCSMTAFVLITGNNCTVNTLALIAINRWIGITKTHATTRRIYTRRNIACMLVVAWFFPLCSALVPVFTDFGEFGYEPRYSSCLWVRDNPYTHLYGLILGVCFFPIQLIIITLCYAAIYRYVIKTSRRTVGRDVTTVSGTVNGIGSGIRKQLWQRKVAVTKNLAYVVLAYIILRTPSVVALIPLGFDWSIRMTPYAAKITFFGCCINPMIYATSHPDFKEALSFMCRGCR
ncbi:melanopsin-like [Patiria miniata]|uniref:G-protein coupled receptors family 1 profile domain-containing protein n=1 Tax=Patiria miniata TaxID=46514 RepID=A0A913Z0Y4_PATMI|nr:melanopsin-like [Patiria miniata]